MTEWITIRRKTQKDATISVILYNSVYKQCLIEIYRYRMGQLTSLGVYNPWKKIVYDKLRLLVIEQLKIKGWTNYVIINIVKMLLKSFQICKAHN